MIVIYIYNIYIYVHVFQHSFSIKTSLLMVKTHMFHVRNGFVCKQSIFNVHVFMVYHYYSYFPPEIAITLISAITLVNPMSMGTPGS